MLINSLALQEEERNVTRTRITALLKTYRKGKVNKAEVDRYFSEWQEVAKRVNKGSAMLDKSTAVQERSKQHMKELEDLYTLLMKLLGMYDAFFKKMFSERPDSYIRAQTKIMDIINQPV